MHKEVNKVFASQPLDLRGGSSNPLGPPRYFGLPMVNPSKPPLPPNKPYHWPFNDPEYVKDSDLNVHVRVFRVAIRTNSETNDAKIREILYDCCNNYMGDYPNFTFAELQLTFVKGIEKFRMMNKFTYS
jgi:hypothetical protein